MLCVCLEHRECPQKPRAAEGCHFACLGWVKSSCWGEWLEVISTIWWVEKPYSYVWTWQTFWAFHQRLKGGTNWRPNQSAWDKAFIWCTWCRVALLHWGHRTLKTCCDTSLYARAPGGQGGQSHFQTSTHWSPAVLPLHAQLCGQERLQLCCQVCWRHTSDILDH